MKRKAGSMLLLAALSGCVATDPNTPGAYMNHVNPAPPPANGIEGAHCGAHVVNGAPGLMGPNGTPVMAMAPAQVPHVNETMAERMARETIAQGLPPGVLQEIDRGNRRNGDIQQVSATMPNAAGMNGLMPPGGPMGAPPAMCGPGGGPGMMPPGMMPPGMMSPNVAPPGAVAAVGALTGGAPSGFAIQRTSVRFVGPSGMKISWYGPTTDGKTGFPGPLRERPGRYNFLQAAIYRLKLSDIPQRPGLNLYPTLEVVPVNNKTATFLAHSSVPVNVTEEDLNQVAAGNFVVKVIYLPDPQYQDLATTGAEEIISSRLEPGVDPIAEACRRGSILLVVRLGNILLELDNTPPMDAPSAQATRQQMMPQGMPGMPGAAGPMPPYGLTGNPRQNQPAPGMMPPGMMPPARVPQGLAPQGALPPELMPQMGTSPTTQSAQANGSGNVVQTAAASAPANKPAASSSGWTLPWLK